MNDTVKHDDLVKLYRLDYEEICPLKLNSIPTGLNILVEILEDKEHTEQTAGGILIPQLTKFKNDNFTPCKVRLLAMGKKALELNENLKIGSTLLIDLCSLFYGCGRIKGRIGITNVENVLLVIGEE